MTFESPDKLTEEVEDEIKLGVGKSAAEEKIALIRLLAARIVEERMLTKDLHEKYLTIDAFDVSNADPENIDMLFKIHQSQFYERDSLLKRVESLSRIIASIWNQMGIAGTSPSNDFMGDLKEKFDARRKTDE